MTKDVFIKEVRDIEALKAMKEIYPKTEDGLETYAMSAYNNSDLHTYFFKGCLGEGYVNLEDGLYVQDAKTNDLVVDIYDKDEDVKLHSGQVWNFITNFTEKVYWIRTISSPRVRILQKNIQKVSILVEL